MSLYDYYPILRLQHKVCCAAQTIEAQIHFHDTLFCKSFDEIPYYLFKAFILGKYTNYNSIFQIIKLCKPCRSRLFVCFEWIFLTLSRRSVQVRHSDRDLRRREDRSTKGEGRSVSVSATTPTTRNCRRGI